MPLQTPWSGKGRDQDPGGHIGELLQYVIQGCLLLKDINDAFQMCWQYLFSS